LTSKIDPSVIVGGEEESATLPDELFSFMSSAKLAVGLFKATKAPPTNEDEDVACLLSL